MIIDPATPQETKVAPQAEMRVRYRIRFAKVDLLKWISHSDLVRLWERILRRALLKPSMTQGFHPKPRMNFLSALALGIESDDELLELDLAERVTPVELFQRLVNDGQPGLIIQSVALIPEHYGKARLARLVYEISVPTSLDVAAIRAGIERVKSTDQVTLDRKKKKVVFDLRKQIESLSHDGHLICLALSPTDEANLRPEDVLELMGLADFVEPTDKFTEPNKFTESHWFTEMGGRIRRTASVLSNEFFSDDPEQMATRHTVSVSSSRPAQFIGVNECLETC
jgi:radical SAM-linked protein